MAALPIIICGTPTAIPAFGIASGPFKLSYRVTFPVTAKGRHWAVPRDICEQLDITDESQLKRLDALDAAGFKRR